MTERRHSIAVNTAAEIYRNQPSKTKNMPGAISDALGESRFNKDDRREVGRSLGFRAGAKAKKRSRTRARYRAIAESERDATSLSAHCDPCRWASECPYTQDDESGLRQAREMLQRCHDKANPGCHRKIMF